MIKVLHFVSTPSISSGVMNIIMNYYRYIDRSEIQFDFLFFISCEPHEKTFVNEIRELGGQVYFTTKPGSSIYSLKELNKFFKTHGSEYNCLHNHEIYLSFFLKLLANRYGIKRFIVHCHATKYSDKPLNAIRNRLLCLPIRFMRCEYVACSKAAGTFLYGKYAVKHKNVFILKNAIEVKRFSFNTVSRIHYRKKLNLNDCFVLGNIGRFVQQKNHRFLILLFNKIAAQIPQARLLLIGTGPRSQEIKNLARSLGLEKKVSFLNECNDIDKLLQVMDLFLLPSLYEGLPLSCLEAQASGLPCLVSDAISEEVILSNYTLRLPLSLDKWEAECLKYWKNFVTASDSNQLFPEYRRSPKVPDIRQEADILSVFYRSTDK